MTKQTVLLSVLFFLIFNTGISQTQKKKVNGLFFSSGIGPAYSFFKLDQPPVAYFNEGQYSAADKRLLGKAIDFEIGYHLTQKTSLSVRFSDQVYSRDLRVTDTLRNTNFIYNLNSKLYSHQYYWQFLISKVFFQKHNHSLGGGIGLFFFKEYRQDSGGIPPSPNGISDPIAYFVEYSSSEFGAPLYLFYEKHVNQAVSFGARVQANFLISAPDFNSISLLPYFRVNF